LLDSTQENLMHRNSLFVLAALLIAGPETPAFAQDVENVVVTATRTAQPAAITGESISVFDSRTLKTLQSTDLSDVLTLAPGLTVDRNGGLGQPTSASIRGAETGQTLVLIDGVRINDPSGTDDGAILGDVLLNNIDRIEVLRGPQSTLYGSNAIGGVIDILTRRGGDTPFALTASAEGGSYDTYHLNAAASGTAGDIDYGAAANFLHTNGISAADKRNGNPETDGYGNFGATANTRIHLDDNVSIDLRGYYTNARVDFDDNSGFTPPFLVSDSSAYNTNRLLTGYAGVNFDLFGGALHNRIAAIASRSGREFFDSAFDIIHKNGQDRGRGLRFEYQGVADISASEQLVFGAEDERTSFANDSFSSFFGNTHDRGHATIASFYGQYQKTLFEAVTLTGGVRYDHNSQFGSHTSLKLAGAWQIGEGTTLHANYGDGFKAPSLFEQFSEFSNPDGPLRPETARGWEAGADQAFLDNRLHASLTYFERRTRNLIDFQSCFVAVPPQPECNLRAVAGGYYVNIGRTRSTGMEAQLTGSVTDTVDISLAYTNQTSKDSLTGLALPRRPRNTASAILNWSPEPSWGLSGSVSYVGREVDQYDSSTTPPTTFWNGSHTVVDVFGHYDIGQWSLYGRVENVFDEHYEPLLGYGAEGRAYFAGVRFSN
ncbi:MAG: TonB-dependent receptor plug domain-containing protein, partial [Rhizomicrobium sp.]